jgi:hypothetical protein
METNAPSPTANLSAASGIAHKASIHAREGVAGGRTPHTQPRHRHPPPPRLPRLARPAPQRPRLRHKMNPPPLLDGPLSPQSERSLLHLISCVAR